MNLTGYGLPYWLDLTRPKFPRLDANLTADIAIVGAGISGLKLARALSKRGISSVILEGARAGEGASGRNQGTLCTGANAYYCDTIGRFQMVDSPNARRLTRDLWQMGVENLELVKEELVELGIDCDFQPEGFCLLVRRDIEGFEGLVQKCRQDAALLAEDGFDVEWMDEACAIRRGGSPVYAGGLWYKADAQFHSGKFILGLAQGVCRSRHVRLFEETRVLRIVGGDRGAEVVTPHGTVSARHVFLLTNALVPQQVPPLAQKLRAERGQVMVTEPMATKPCVGSFATDRAWWREIPEADGRFRLLFGGGRGRDEPDSLFRQYDPAGSPNPLLEHEGFSPSIAHQERLNVEFAKLFPTLSGARITHRWGGLQSFTADSLPMFGVFDTSRSIHGMAGFSGRGNTYTNVGAEYLAGRIVGTPSAVEERYRALFSQILAVNRTSAVWDAWETNPGGKTA